MNIKHFEKNKLILSQYLILALSVFCGLGQAEVPDTGNLVDNGGAWQNLPGGCESGGGIMQAVDFNRDGTDDTLVEVIASSGDAYLVNTGTITVPSYHIFLDSTCFTVNPPNVSVSINFYNMLADGFNIANKNTWVRKTVPGVRTTHILSGLGTSSVTASNGVQNVQPYYSSGITNLYIDTARGIRSLQITSNDPESNIEVLELLRQFPNTAAGTNVSVTLDNGSAVMRSVTVPGNTHIVPADSRGIAAPTNMAICAPPLDPDKPYFEVQTSASNDSTNPTPSTAASICYNYPASCDETSIGISAYITICGLAGCISSWRSILSSVDTVTNTICASNPARNVFIVTHAIADTDGDGVNNLTDCNDLDNAVYPGAPELCDAKDNNCNLQIDEGCPVLNNGDFDADGVIGAADHQAFLGTYALCSGDFGFITEADYDSNGCIDRADYRQWYRYYLGF